MRIVFSGFLLALSIFFTAYGSKYDYATSSGQVGAGFFPFWLGAFLILFTTISLIKDIKFYMKERSKMQISSNVMTLLIIIGITAIFIAILRPLGAVLSMIIYIFVVLFILNRERILLNTVVTLSVSLGTYFLLEVWLKAGFPKGIFGF